MLHRLHPLLVALLIAVVAGAVAVPTSHAQHVLNVERSQVTNPRPVPEALDDYWKGTCRHRVLPYDGSPSLGMNPVFDKQATSDIVIDFNINDPDNNVSAADEQAAREAFRRAAEIWEQYIESDVTIRIDATLADLGGVDDAGLITLGAAGPSLIIGTFTQQTPDGQESFDRIIGLPLFEAIVAQPVEVLNPDFERSSTDPEIFAQFNINPEISWHYGEGEPEPGEIDFTTVILHEIGHGLNFVDTFDYNDADGGPCDGGEGTACWGFGDNDNNGNPLPPGVFADFMVESTSDESGGTPVLSLDNNSLELGDALLTGEASDGSERIFMDGQQGRRGALRTPVGPERPQIYAPSSWEPGSSIAHVDQDVYAMPTNPDRLMTPRIIQGVATRMPGPIFCGILSDFGWPLGDGCRGSLFDVFNVQASVQASGGDVQLTWEVSDQVTIDEFAVEQSRFGGDFVEVDRISGDERTVTLQNLGIGRYVFRLSYTNQLGEPETSTEQEVVLNVSNLQTQASAPNEATGGRVGIGLSWGLPPGSNDFSVSYVVERTYDALDDEDVEFEAIASGLGQTETQFTDEKQLPGTSPSYRIRTIDSGGGEIVSETLTVDIPSESDFFTLGPFPNPATRQSSIELSANSSQTVDVEVYDSIGRLIYEESRSVARGAPERVTFDASRWSSGMYFIRLRGERTTLTRQLAITK